MTTAIKQKTIVVVGAKDTGKTSLSYLHFRNNIMRREAAGNMFEKRKKPFQDKSTMEDSIYSEYKLFVDFDSFKKEYVTTLKASQNNKDNEELKRKFKFLESKYQQIEKILSENFKSKTEEMLNEMNELEKKQQEDEDSSKDGGDDSSSEQSSSNVDLDQQSLHSTVKRTGSQYKTFKGNMESSSISPSVHAIATPTSATGTEFPPPIPMLQVPPLTANVTTTEQIGQSKLPREPSSEEISSRGDSQDLLINETVPARNLRIGIEKFAQSYKEGLKFLKLKEILPGDDPIAISKFLLKTTDVDREQLGLVLGQKDMTILNAFCELAILNLYSKMTFENAFRLFFTLFQMPREGQQVARISEAFAETYCRVIPNSELKDDPDNAALLAASILMLNVSLHSPKVKPKDRLTQKSYCEMLKSTKFKEEFLVNLFASIQKSEIKVLDTQAQAGSNSSIKKGGAFGFGGNKTLKKLQHDSSFIALTSESKNKVQVPGCDNLFKETVRILQHQSGSDPLMTSSTSSVVLSFPAGLSAVVIKDMCSAHQDLDKDLSFADCCLVVFSVADEQSFLNALNIVNSIVQLQVQLENPIKSTRASVVQQKGIQNAENLKEAAAKKVILVANKTDEKRKISSVKGIQAALELGVGYFETSCIKNENVEELFQYAITIVDARFAPIEPIELDPYSRMAEFTPRFLF